MSIKSVISSLVHL